MHRRFVTLLALLGIAACRGSDPQPLTLVLGADDPWGGGTVIAGGGASEYLAYGATIGGHLGVRVVRHRSTLPDELELVTDLATSVGYGEGLVSVSGTDRLTLCRGVSVSVYDLENPSLPPIDVSLASAPDGVAVEGGWLLASTGTALTLVSLDAPATRSSFVAGASITSILPTQGTFLAFTAAGYVHVVPDASAPTFTQTDDPEVRSFRSAYPDGLQAIVAGPATSFNRSRVVRLDLSTPAFPVVARSHEVDGRFVSFAWDGAGVSVIAIEPPEYTQTVGWLVREENGSFRSSGIPLPAMIFAAHAERFFAFRDFGGFSMWAIR